MKKFLLLVGVAAMALTSCSRDEATSVNLGEGINFRPAMGTRADEVTVSTLASDGFMVTALKGDETYFSNLEFTTGDSGSTYTSSPVYYWPSTETLNFYAWYPTTLSDVTVSSTAQTISYTPAYTVADQEDVIVADASGDKENNGEIGVPLTFNHALSQIVIKAKNTNSAYVLKVKQVKICNIANTGVLAIDTDGTSAVAETTTPVNYSWGENYLTVSSDAEELGTDGGAMVIPQSFTGWDTTDGTNADNGAYIAVKVDVDTDSGANVFPDSDGLYGWIAVPISGTWERGYKYTYTLDFSKGFGYDAPGDVKDNDGDGDDTGDDDDDEDDEEDDDDTDGREDGEEIISSDSPIFFTVTVSAWTDADAISVEM